MHPIDQWLQQANKTRSWLAHEARTTEATLSRLVAGKQWPTRKLAERIRQATDGTVTPNDFAAAPVADREAS